MVKSIVIVSILMLGCQSPTSQEKPKDTSPPQVLIVQPTDNDTLFTSVFIKVIATDNDSIKEVVFKVDGEDIGKLNSSPYKLFWNVSYWADGANHSISASALDLANNIGYSDTVLVVVSRNAMSLPMLISPQNDTVFRNANSVKFIWYSLSDAVQYQLLVSNRTDFTELEYSESVIDTQMTLTLSKSLHYWKVRAQNAVGLWTEWSETNRFEIDGPVPPILLSPENQSSIADTISPMFIWKSSPYSSNYELEISSKLDFSDVEFSTIIPDTHITINTLSKGWHHWRVRGQNSVGIWGNRSQVFVFLVMTTKTVMDFVNEGWLAYVDGNYVLAIAKFKEALNQTLTQDQEFAHNGLGWTYASNAVDSLDKALESFDAAVLIKADFVEAYSGRGFVQMALKNYLSAIDDFVLALQLDPNFVFSHNSEINSNDLHLGLAEAYFFRQNLSAAQAQVDELEPTNGLNPNNADTWVVDGITFGTYAEALLAWIEKLKFII